MTKEEYKKYFLNEIHPSYVISGNLDYQRITHNDGTMWILPYGCNEQFSSDEWYELNMEYYKKYFKNKV